MIIGITGKSGAGKNVVARILKDERFFPIDCDLLGHQALFDCKEQVEKAFNIHLPIVDGKIDRRELASIVFSNPEKLHQLEAILYPIVTDQCKQIISQHQDVTINGAKLMESGLYSLCDAVFWITAPKWVRLRRTMERDGLTRKQILARFSNQKELSAQPWKKLVDIYYISNFGLFSLFQRKIGWALEKVQKRSKKHEQ